MIYFIKKYLICFLLIFSILLSNLKYTHNLKKLKIYNLKIFKYIKLKKKKKSWGDRGPRLLLCGSATDHSQTQNLKTMCS